MSNISNTKRKEKQEILFKAGGFAGKILKEKGKNDRFGGELSRKGGKAKWS